MTLDVRQDRTLIRPGGRSDRYLLVTVVAPTVRREAKRPPVNLAFVLDRSGSMSGPKIDLAKQAVRRALESLSAEDRFAVVVYDDRIDVVVENSPASAEALRGATDRLAAIDARGSTNLAEGWLRGCQQVAGHQVAGAIDRALLLSDGLANVGITDPAELEHHAAELRRRGISTTTFGVGSDFDEALLQRLADQGGGHFYFIDNERQIPDFIASEVGETLEVVARDVAVEVSSPDGLVVDPLTALPAARSDSGTRFELGDLVSGQERAIVLKLNFPRGEVGRERAATVSLGDRESVFDGPAVAVRWTYAPDRDNDAQPRERVVDRAVAAIYAARARQEAVRLNRLGDFAAASAAIEAVARRIRRYAGEDPGLHATIRELEEERADWLAPMPEAARKQAHFASYRMMACRDEGGRARRRP